MWHMWRYPIPFPMRLARAVSKGKPIMVQALKASARQTNFQKLRVKMPHKLCNIFESEATPAWGRLCLQGMWQMRKGKGNEKRRGAQRVPSTGQTASEEKNIMEMEILQSNNFTIAREMQKPQRHPRWKMLFQRKTPHTQRVTGGGWQQMEWREKKSKLRDTFAQLVNDLDSCGEHVCECWSIGVFVCVCAHHVRRLTIDWVVVVVVVVAWRRRKLRVVNSWPHTENVRANQCVCACVLPFVLYEFS